MKFIKLKSIDKLLTSLTYKLLAGEHIGIACTSTKEGIKLIKAIKDNIPQEAFEFDRKKSIHLKNGGRLTIDKISDKSSIRLAFLGRSLNCLVIYRLKPKQELRLKEYVLPCVAAVKDSEVITL